MTPNDRIYLDYNATSPLAESVKHFLANGDVPFANPSSQHASGKKSLRLVNDTREFLFHFFSLSRKTYEIFFHSGATEGINTVLNLNADEALIYYSSDHPCVSEQALRLKNKEIQTIELGLRADASLDIKKLIGEIKSLELLGKRVWVNLTWVHNETGHVVDLDFCRQLKLETSCFIHVDAVQSVGKIESFSKLSNDVDAYTFSGHKFGALKGVGFTFFKKNLKLNSLISGGGQQGGIRSGTVNVQGILSLKLALEELQNSFEAKDLLIFKESIKDLIGSNQNLELINLANQNLTTVYFVHKSKRSDSLLIHFDMAAIDVSAGSACSAGALTPSKTLIALGMQQFSQNGIRISFGPGSLKQKDKILKALDKVICNI